MFDKLYSQGLQNVFWSAGKIFTDEIHVLVTLYERLFYLYIYIFFFCKKISAFSQFSWKIGELARWKEWEGFTSFEIASDYFIIFFFFTGEKYVSRRL
jgi:hypothetical protein